MTVGPNNVIANNPSGVIVSDATDVYNTITHNSIYNNGSGGTGLGIQLLNHSQPLDRAADPEPVGRVADGGQGHGLRRLHGRGLHGRRRMPATRAPGLAGQGKVFLGSTPRARPAVPSRSASARRWPRATGHRHGHRRGRRDVPVQHERRCSLDGLAPPRRRRPCRPPRRALTTYAADTFTRTPQPDLGPRRTWRQLRRLLLHQRRHERRRARPPPSSCPIPPPDELPRDGTVDTNYRGGYLTNVSAENVDVRFRVATATLATSDNINVGFDVRRVSGFTSYRGQVRLTTDEPGLAPGRRGHQRQHDPARDEPRAHAASVTAGAFIWVRGQVTGTNPTTIKMKAWNDGTRLSRAPGTTPRPTRPASSRRRARPACWAGCPRPGTRARSRSASTTST